MLTKCFKRDFDTKVYGERGFGAGSLRVLPYPDVEKIIASEKANLLVAKPLVESQYALKMLRHFAGSKGIWAYRHYQDVANSSFNKFGAESSIKNLRPIVDPDVELDWASENVSEATRAVVAEHFSEDMNTYDAKALFWYVRNILFYEQQLDTNPDVILIKYENIAQDPGMVMKSVYQFLERPYPGHNLVADIHSRSVKLGKDVPISQPLRDLCDGLLERLDQTRMSLYQGVC